jgi:hypothetical protein
MAAPLAAQTPEPPIWVVEDENSTIYMIGTVHMMRNGVDWESPQLAEILDEVDSVWLELDSFEPPANLFGLIMTSGMSPDRPLSLLLNDEEMAGLQTILDEHGVPLDSFDGLRPWYAYLQISALMLVEAGFDPEGGIDMHIKARADEMGNWTCCARRLSNMRTPKPSLSMSWKAGSKAIFQRSKRKPPKSPRNSKGFTKCCLPTAITALSMVSRTFWPVRAQRWLPWGWAIMSARIPFLKSWRHAATPLNGAN